MQNLNIFTKSRIRTNLNNEIFTLLIKKALYSIVFAVLTGLASKVRFFMSFTPVPITGQVFMVLISGLLLGPEFGSLSQMLYIFLGLSGIPWFALGSLFGPTGGYLIGFIIAPYLVGSIAKRKATLIPLALIAGIVIIYIFGAMQFSIIMKTGLMKTLELAVLPFIPFDIAKSALIILIISLYKKIRN